MRRAFSLVEVCVVAGIGVALIVPFFTLASDNMHTPDDVADRELIQGLCLDTIERLKSTPLDHALPGASGEGAAAMAGPVELDPKRTTLFDRVYLDRLAGLYTNIVPKIVRTPDAANPSLFKLECTIRWRDRHGKDRVTREARWCYAPLSDGGEPAAP